MDIDETNPQPPAEAKNRAQSELSDAALEQASGGHQVAKNFHSPFEKSAH